MAEMSMVPPQMLGGVWRKSERLIDKLQRVSHGRFENQDILHELFSGKQQFWAVWDGEIDGLPIIGVVITEIMAYPRKRILCIQYCAGDRLNEWMSDILELLEEWAKTCDCDGLELTGRRGWVRTLQPEGWKEEYVVVSKSFEEPEITVAFDRPQLELIEGLEVANGR